MVIKTHWQLLCIKRDNPIFIFYLMSFAGAKTRLKNVYFLIYFKILDTNQYIFNVKDSKMNPALDEVLYLFFSCKY